MVGNVVNRNTRRHAESGYSLVEIMIVVLLIGVIAGMAVPVTSYMINQSKNDSGIVAALGAVETARDRAIAERRNFELTFVMPNIIRLVREEVPGPATTIVSEFVLENGQEFVKFGSVPDTPDLFGASSAISFSGTAPVMFTSDGSLVDSNGDVINGSVFLGLPGQPDSARAITIFGVSGLTRTWKWRGSKWFE